MFKDFEQHLKHLEPADWLRFLGHEWLWRLANPINQQPYWLLGRSSEEDSPYVAFAQALMAWWPLVETRFGRRITAWPLLAIALAYAHCTAGFQGASPLQRWVEKTPTNERFIARLTAEFPDAKLVHVVRHPFAVYASHQRAARNVGKPLSDGHRILHQMRRSYQEAAHRTVRSSDSYMLLRYEDLIEDTSGSIHHLASFLGIQTLPAMMQPTVNGIPTTSNSSFRRDEAAGQLSHRPAGDVFGVLTPRDRERVSAMVGDAAARLGYQLAPLPALRRKLLRMLIRAGRVAYHLRA
jgi:hypothetical protein